MQSSTKPPFYRELIDSLVHECLHGQGQIGPRRAREGIWNRSATEDSIQEQYAVNQLLARLSHADREVIAQLLAEAFQGGVFETLKALEQFGVSPFEDGYEGSAFHDFVGRLQDWDWPES